ncbi:hypothetical protein DDZ14_14155 [Maritimibacter sp. 55A14]|uniref:hypothetical protein n=1 Tax=Maritimibacter sp. 55A14 TaxID=2174844 RepID=UPI000D61863C|nr:hypothetical protein [Maritimibacter sp. 55A14]PWE31160.1 hypothetical protein DDZ14_14155 [Maritimibacter sp. 55A14]
MTGDPITLLKDERDKIIKKRNEACAPFDAQIAEYDAAIAAIEGVRGDRGRSGVQSTVLSGSGPKMARDEAVIEAIKNGKRQPVAILDFIIRHLGIETTINSVRTRLSRLKNEGRIAHDSRGWIMPHEISEGLPLNENDRPSGRSDAEEGDASSEKVEWE